MMGRNQDYKHDIFDEWFEQPSQDDIQSARAYQNQLRANNMEHKRCVEEIIMNAPQRLLPILGCLLGDFVGSRFERDYAEFVDLGDYNFFDPECKFTDDTVFTLAIAEAFVKDAPTSQGFTDSMIEWGRRYPNAGFGRATQAWIASDSPQPYGSNRNGAAMRVAPCACFANSLDQALEYAKISAEVSHNTPEGVAGAQAIAAAIYLALNKASKDEIKDYIEAHFDYKLNQTMEQLHQSWSGFSCRASDTVPQAIICYLQSHNVESAIRNGISLCSDADTLAAMAGAIAAADYGYMPHLWQYLEMMPIDILYQLMRISDKLRNLQNHTQE